MDLEKSRWVCEEILKKSQPDFDDDDFEDF